MIELFDLVTVSLLGLTVSFAPCMFPILPSFIAFLTQSTQTTFGTDEESKKPQIWGAIMASFLVTLGIMTIFVSLGLVINLIVLDVFTQNYRAFRFFQGLILLILGIVLAFNVKIGIFTLSTLAGKVSTFLQKVNNPWLVSYLIGVFFTLLGAPCGIVAFGTVFFLVASKTFLETILLMFIFSMSAGIPFFIVAVILPSFQGTIEKDSWLLRYLPSFAGILVLLVGCYLMYDAINLGFSLW